MVLRKRKPYIRLLEVAGPDTEMTLQGNEDFAPVHRDPADFRKMTGSFCTAFKLQHVKTGRL